MLLVVPRACCLASATRNKQKQGDKNGDDGKKKRGWKGRRAYLSTTMLLVVPESRCLTRAKQHNSQQQQDGRW